jgi:hypothetical protein
MNWTNINKNNTDRPASVAKYSEYKPYLRTEAKKKCVYCAIHEGRLGGIDHFHVEHFKPKSIDRFAKLEKDFNNLFYSCPICNRFKSNDWPNDPNDDFSNISYIDPSKANYNDVFNIEENGKITGNYIASNYMIEKIFLNRPQLINERREQIARKKLMQSFERINGLEDNLKTKIHQQAVQQLILQSMALKNKIIYLLHAENDICKYKPQEIKRK